jgi:hypothetical protein
MKRIVQDKYGSLMSPALGHSASSLYSGSQPSRYRVASRLGTCAYA